MYALSTVGKEIKEVQAILLTHWHNDHAAGAKAVQLLSGARVYYHQNELPYFTRQTASTGVRAWIADLAPEWGPFILVKGLLGSSLPRGVEATTFAAGGQHIENGFLVIETPGHTPGHVSFYYQPQRILFAGDALAVIGNRIRFMARPVTPDLPTSRVSMMRCLELEIDYLCPGHRGPLTTNLREQCSAMMRYLNSNGKWPLFG